MKPGVGYRCIRCGSPYPLDLPIDSRGCPACAATLPANLRVAYPDSFPGPTLLGAAAGLPSLWRYAAWLPFEPRDAVSLGEGLTPIVAAEKMAARLGVGRLLLKDESRNPTGSHKDRFSTLAVTAARLVGAPLVASASSGNAGASLAAYAARAGLACVVATFAGASGPLLGQIRKLGARVVPFARKADRWRFLAQGAQEQGWFVTSPFRAPVVGSHPLGLEGYKTLAWEIVEQLHGEVPDWCVLPVCYGDALAGLWWGFQALHDRGRIDRLPRLVAAEAHGSLAEALAKGSALPPEVDAACESLAVSIGATRSSFQALQALRASRGLARPVGNAGLIALQEELAAREGVFVELASVTPLAAIAALSRDGVIRKRDSVVAVLTAGGLKDLDRSSGDLAPLPTFASPEEAWARLRHDHASPIAAQA